MRPSSGLPEIKDGCYSLIMLMTRRLTSMTFCLNATMETSLSPLETLMFECMLLGMDCTQGCLTWRKQRPYHSCLGELCRKTVPRIGSLLQKLLKEAILPSLALSMFIIH